MKPVPLSKWRLTHNLARTIAESLWGRGGTHSYRVNRRGVFYFSCAGHGGYVIDPQSLTDHERELLRSLLPTVEVRLCVQRQRGGRMVIAERPEMSNRSARYRPELGPVEWISRAVWIGEEDCDWAKVECMTSIRADGFDHLTEDQRHFLALKTFGFWVRRSLHNEERRRLLRQGVPLRCSALSTGDGRVHVLFQTEEGRGGPLVGYYMSPETYDAIPLLALARPEDYARIGTIEPAPPSFY